jgi:hypothetical protein
MLEEEPQERLAAIVEPGREHQIAVPLLEQDIDEAGMHGLQAVPVDVLGHARGENGAYGLRGLRGIAEDRLEKRIMWNVHPLRAGLLRQGVRRVVRRLAGHDAAFIQQGCDT